MQYTSIYSTLLMKFHKRGLYMQVANWKTQGRQLLSLKYHYHLMVIIYKVSSLLLSKYYFSYYCYYFQKDCCKLQEETLLREENSKIELYRECCLQTNSVRKFVTYFSSLFYCFILSQDQATAEADKHIPNWCILLLKPLVLHWFTSSNNSSNRVSVVPDVWDNLNLYCHFNQVDLSWITSKPELCFHYTEVCMQYSHNM